jgi:hypothetical protein
MIDRPLTKLAAGLFALGACAGACTAALDFTECRQDSDCSKFFSNEKPMRCEDFQCVEADKCDGNSECAGLGEGYVCTVVGTCVQVANDECAAPVYPDDEPNDDVVLIGSIVAKDGPDKAVGEAVEKAIRKAVADFNASAALQGKAVALVPCDSKGVVATARAAAEHLGDRLAVPTILGPVDDLEFYDVLNNVTTKNGIRAFTMSPTANAEIDFNDSSLGWQGQVAAVHQGRAIGRYLAYEMENDVFAAKPNTVMLFAQDDKYGYSMYGAIATEDDPNSAVNRIPEAGAQQTASYRTVEDGAATLDKYINADTDALVLLGGAEVAELLKYWSGTGNPWPTRVYVGNASAQAVLALGDANLAGSLRVIAQDIAGEAALAVQERVDSALPEAVLAYDATMATLLGMAAVPESSALTGPNIVKGMALLNLADGTPVAFGDDPASFVKAASDALNTGAGLSISGGSGALDWAKDGTLCDRLAAFSYDGAAYTRIDQYEPDCAAKTGKWSAAE